MAETSEPTAERRAADLPVPAGTARFLVLATAFCCAACGLVYELELIAMADYLVGNTVTHTSIVLSLMVFAMGIGSLAAKRLRGPASLSFGLIEALLAVVGGGSALALHGCFVVFGEALPALLVLSLAIGLLIGAEMPLLMTLIQRIRAQDPGGAMADLSAADYVGALLGGLAFPFLLLPALGELTAALLTGIANALVGGATVLWLFRGDLTPRTRRHLTAAVAAAIALLLAATTLTGPLERAAARALPDRAAHSAGARGASGTAERSAERSGAQETGETDGTDDMSDPRGGAG